MNTKLNVKKIDENANRQLLDELLNTCLENEPVTRDTISLYTSENFFNETDSESIRSTSGFLSYYRSLTTDESMCFISLFKFMSAGLLIYYANADISNLTSEENQTHLDTSGRKIEDLLNAHTRPLLFMVAYKLDQNNFGTEYIICKIPGSNSLYNLLYQYNQKHFNCKLSFEDLLVEALKHETEID